MANFKTTIITKKGHALMAKLSANVATMKFTKVCSSDFDYSNLNNSELEQVITFKNLKQTVLPDLITVVNTTTVKVSATITNTNLSEGYYLRTIGLFALDPDDGEILYSITPTTEADYMAADNGITKSGISLDLLTTISNSENVSLEVDPNAMISAETFNNVVGNVSDLENGGTNLVDGINKNTARLNDLANLNLFINGGFSVWQRGTSFSTNGYTADRWMYDVEGDDKGKIVRHANGGVQIKLISNKRFWFMQRIELNQELKNIFSNSTVTLSFYVTTSAGVKISPYIRVLSPSRNANIFLKSYEAKATRQLIECQITLGDLSSDDWLGIDIFRIEEDNKFTVGDDLYIRFENAKLELGTKATPFVPRPYGEELALCQRYYEEVPAGQQVLGVKDNVNAFIYWNFIVEKRINPTVSFTHPGYDNNHVNAYSNNIELANTPVEIEWTNKRTARMKIPALSSVPIGSAISAFGAITIDAEIY